MSYVNTISHFPRHTGIKNLSASRHPYLFSTPPPFAVLTGIIFPSDLSSISPPLRRSTGGLSHSLCHPGVMVHSPFLPWHAPVEKVIWSPLRVRAAAPAIKQHIINHICAPRLWSRMLRHTEMIAQVSRLIRSDSLPSRSPAGHSSGMQGCEGIFVEYPQGYKGLITTEKCFRPDNKWSASTDRLSCLVLTCIPDLSPVATRDCISSSFFSA